MISVCRNSRIDQGRTVLKSINLGISAGLMTLVLSDGHSGAADNVLSHLTGWWDEGVDQKTLCSEGRPRHRMVPDRSGETLTFEYDKPVKRYDGLEGRLFRYQIVGASATTATLKLENETRQTPEGSLVVWELALIDPTTYRWHASHLPEGTYNKVLGKRCGR